MNVKVDEFLKGNFVLELEAVLVCYHAAFLYVNFYSDGWSSGVCPGFLMMTVTSPTCTLLFLK